jgi:hypothetical protein
LRINVFIFHIMLTRQEIFRGCTAGFASVCYDYIKQTKKGKSNMERKRDLQCNANEERKEWIGLDRDCVDQIQMVTASLLRFALLKILMQLCTLCWVHVINWFSVFELDGPSKHLSFFLVDHALLCSYFLPL